MAPEFDLLEVTRGSVIAPAGCGKTELIASSLSRASDELPALVLTHTNAGVHALEQRLQKRGVSKAKFKVATIDNWSLRIATMFPATSGFIPQVGKRRTNPDYVKQKACALAVLQSGALDELLPCTYSRLIVDEYQDCTLQQHDIICRIADILPTAVLGDPLQAVFGWPGNVLVKWTSNVEAQFPRIGILREPWRWINANTRSFGEWLIEVRTPLRKGEAIDLSNAPPEVQWVQLKDLNDFEGRRQACTYRPEGGGTVLIIADSVDKNGQKSMACMTPGASTVEAVDLKDLLAFADSFEPDTDGALEHLLDFASDLLTRVDKDNLLARVDRLQRGTARTPANRIEGVALAYLAEPSFIGARILLEALAANDGARIYRPAIFYPTLDALRLMGKGHENLYEAAMSVRERLRHEGRQLPKHAVGSTLLLKGLEAEVAVILNPEKMTREHLYVALTRGAKKVLICSPSPVIRPAVK